MAEHIQINDVAPRIAYVADGVQAAFAYPFALFRASDMEVWLDDAVQGGGFTVSGAGISSGGTVLFAVPPSAGVRVTLRRRVPLVRTTDFQSDGLIRAKTLNDEMDYQVASLQQVAEEAGRAVKRSPTSASLADLTLPEPEAGRVLKWNPGGDGLVNSGFDPDQLASARTEVLAAAAAVAGAHGETLAARDQAVAAAASVADPLARSANLADLADAAVARTNLAVYSAAETDAAIAAAGPGSSVLDRLAFLEANLAVNTLRDQIDSGWSVLKMVDGIADEFEDTTGIASLGGATYDAAGDYVHNAGSAYARIANATPYAPLGGTAENFNDNNPATECVSAALGNLVGTATSARILAKLDLGSVRTVTKIEAIGIYAAAGGSQNTNYTGAGLFYSTDGTIWTQAGSGETDITATAQTITATGSWSARYVAVTAGEDNWGGGQQAVKDLNAYEASATANVTVVSAAFTAQTQPDEARLVLLHQPVAAVALNTDVAIEASRDNGTTWSAGTLVNEGAFDATTNILSAVVDLSGQPAGTAMKWRYRTFNTKEQRLHGVWMQWR
ncbi:hypothetical protein [Magnetospirillum sp. UT-4]|uniref:hypothetical protein n=1 Tax=Magnetospirillum sp. UT-4 TaxID=2681467 RepID=UPI001383E23D|nr:hypothetical protein [Magnetospirillum sp. UT-4]CAA7617659.1 hypothetical protein MTBUT4_260058 [Magnetospirillum sp. UT-4]